MEADGERELDAVKHFRCHSWSPLVIGTIVRS
jgi:hypothetical protein